MVACAHRVALAVLRGGQAASAESCTHPAKRDHRFPPPVAERQRLPNVRISSAKRFQFPFEFPWSLFPMIQSTFGLLCTDNGFGAKQAISHYFNQGWPDLLEHTCVTRARCVNMLSGVGLSKELFVSFLSVSFKYSQAFLWILNLWVPPKIWVHCIDFYSTLPLIFQASTWFV